MPGPGRLLSDGDAAESLYRERSTAGRTQLRPELARAHLLYGEWLRRQGRRIEPGSSSAPPTRCSPRSAWRRSPSAPAASLSPPARSARAPSEHETPHAAGGAHRPDGQRRSTNPEIGARLFLSARTVEWHLGKVFAKLGISSRRELRGRAAEVRAGRNDGLVSAAPSGRETGPIPWWWVDADQGSAECIVPCPDVPNRALNVP